MHSDSLAAVKHYYGQVLASNRDLKTSACCPTESMPPELAAIAAEVHPEILERFYGCGLVIPPCLEGLTVLDLGCGTGRDVYILSKLVGPKGRVIGIDMTPEQIALARRHQDYHAQKFGFNNVSFVDGMIEDLEGAGIASASIDLVVSNCVINLSPDKERVMREVLRVLKPGGEMYFSDVYADRRLPAPLRRDEVVLGECLGGAAYVEDFRRLLSKLDINDFRAISRAPIEITNAEVKRRVGNARFASVTYRIFKMDLEDRCEDYGQVAYYLGTMAESPHAFTLDDHHHFEAHRPLTVCSNTAQMLQASRYGRHFRVVGDLSTHFGLFPCGPTTPALASQASNASGAACC